MNDVIYRQAALDALGERPMVWTDDDYVLGARNQYDMDRLAIETVPSAQPEIIRCKSCRHDNNCEIQYAAQAGSEFFCGAAERREE